MVDKIPRNRGDSGPPAQNRGTLGLQQPGTSGAEGAATFPGRRRRTGWLQCPANAVLGHLLKVQAECTVIRLR